MENSGWRTLQPLHLYDHIDNRIIKVLE
jgi:hypothetical protein